MALYIDVKYANIIAPRFRNFKRKNDYLWNFSCPICGDSKTVRTKARGYIYKVKVGLFVKCHKCGYSKNLGSFINQIDPNLYEEYVLENYKEGGAPRSHHKDAKIAIPEIIKPPELTDSILDPIKRLDTLPLDHPAFKYVLSRQIPSRAFSRLYYAPKFKAFVNSLIPNKFRDEVPEHPRLIIPYFDAYGKCFAFQGRAFGNEDPKYCTIKLDEDRERIYGLDKIDYSRRIYAFEGPIDSLFVPNAIAVSGSSFLTPTIEALKTNLTIVYDNEPRSPELLKLINKTIEAGFSICLWPEWIKFKDVNDMVQEGGMTPEEILSTINEHTYSGAAAALRFATWRKSDVR